jgi:hypothetical protein
VLEQEKQVTNWINSGGHVPHRHAQSSNRETTGRHRADRWKGPLIIGSVLLMLPLAAVPGAARDPDGRYANSPLKQWFDSLKSGRGPCCSDADGSAVSDVDWESKGGHYRVRIDATLEDLAGNSIARVFDADRRRGAPGAEDNERAGPWPGAAWSRQSLGPSSSAARRQLSVAVRMRWRSQTRYQAK